MLDPKLHPCLIAIVTGIALILVGQTEVGLSVLGTGVGALGLGYATANEATVLRSEQEDGNPDMTLAGP